MIDLRLRDRWRVVVLGLPLARLHSLHRLTQPCTLREYTAAGNSLKLTHLSLYIIESALAGGVLEKTLDKLCQCPTYGRCLSIQSGSDRSYLNSMVLWHPLVLFVTWYNAGTDINGLCFGFGYTEDPRNSVH